MSCGVGEHPERVRRRIVPDRAQVQLILGSLRGDARSEGPDGGRYMTVSHRRERADYVRWKYERLGALAAHAPIEYGERVGFRTIAHPLFDDLAPLFRMRRAGRGRVVKDLLTPLGLAVWMSDAGRLELRADLFLPAQRELALTA